MKRQLMLIIALALVIALLLGSCAVQMPLSSEDGTQTGALAASADDNGEELAVNPTMCWASILSIKGAEYSSVYGDDGQIIVPGDVVAVCDWFIPARYRKTTPDDAVASTVVKEGGEIYEWSGYDSSFRVCIVEPHSDRILGFQRGGDKFWIEMALSGEKVSHLYGDFSDEVTEIIILGGNNSTEVGRISDPLTARAVAREILALEYTQEAYLDVASGLRTEDYWTDSKGVVLVKEDGTREQFSLCKNGMGVAGGCVDMSGEIRDTVLSAVAFNGNEVLPNSMNRGLVAGRDYVDVAGDYDWNNTVWEMYIDVPEGGVLYMTPYFGFDMRHLIDGGPVSCLQRKRTDVYYLDGAGRIMRVYCEGVRDEASLHEFLVEGGDVTEYIKTEPYDAGPYQSFRIVSGVFYTLLPDGTLMRDGEPVATGVTRFEGDEDAVTYVTAEGLFRLYTGGNIIKLAAGEIKCFALAMSRVYYSQGGAVYAVSVRGGESEKVYDIDASEMIYTWFMKGGFVFVDEGTGALKLRFLDVPDADVTVIESGVSHIGFYNEYCLAAVAGDEIYVVSLNSYHEKATADEGYWIDAYDEYLFRTKSEGLELARQRAEGE